MSRNESDPTQGLDSSQQLLPHLSFNESGTSTIVFLHGMSCSPAEWENVHPHLSTQASNDSPSYHVLVPYLPGHGQASAFTPFSLPDAAELIANLIRQKAKDGKAHIVGMSLGGFVAVNVAKHHPELVLSLFSTGVGGLAGHAWLAGSAPYLLTAVLGLQYFAPESTYQWLQRKQGLQIPNGLREEMWANAKIDLLKAAYRSIDADGGAVPLNARSLIVAGGAGDSKEGTVEYGKQVKKGNVESRAAVVNGAMVSIQRAQGFTFDLRLHVTVVLDIC